MSQIVSKNPVSQKGILVIGVVLVGVVLSIATVRFSGVGVREPDAATVATRSLRFEDGPNGSVAVIDARSGQVLEYVQGEAGFLRGSLRAMARERQKRGIGNGPPFQLSSRTNGRLTLEDPATGERIDLESFGPTNAATYARMLSASPTTAPVPAPSVNPALVPATR